VLLAVALLMAVMLFCMAAIWLLTI